MRLIDADELIEYLVTNMRWIDEDDNTVDDTDEKRAILTDLVNGVQTIDAIPKRLTGGEGNDDLSLYYGRNASLQKLSTL